MNEWLFIFLMIASITAFVLFSVNIDFKPNSFEEPNEYQGPVPEGYDEGHFRKTGETIKEGVSG